MIESLRSSLSKSVVDGWREKPLQALLTAVKSVRLDIFTRPLETDGRSKARKQKV